MRKRKFMKVKSYGIQSRFLKYVMLLLAVALLLSGMGVGIVVNKNINRSTIEKYAYVNEKISLILQNEYDKTDVVMKKCIANQEFQTSLLNKEFTQEEQESLNRFLSAVDLDHVEDYLYIDNKENIYSKSYKDITYDDVIESGFVSALGKEYSRTEWIWAKDTLFHTEENALFVGRYIRNREFTHKPGMLFFRLDSNFFDFILEDVRTEKGVYFFLDSSGKVCSYHVPPESSLNQEEMESIGKQVFLDSQKINSENKEQIFRIKEGVVVYEFQPKFGFMAATLIPNGVLNEVTIRTIVILVGVFILATGIALILSVYFSKRFTKPIREINDAMAGFDGEDFSKKLRIQTQTELDTIGNSYNKMLKNIELLVDEVKEKERSLRNSELNSLIYQINPHFLYNTLDTIYMLARINKEETTMKMIQALSKFLKISLSKGSDIIPVSAELEHVKSYMEIQRIRNNNLFTYDITCQKGLEDFRILKLILQPLVENAIKHGFQKIYEGGVIGIQVVSEEKNIMIRVWNNGVPMEEAVQEKIQSMADMDLKDMADAFEGQDGGYGVRNVMSRLFLKYGKQVEFYYETRQEGTCCVIKIPVKKIEEDSTYEME